MYHHEYLEKKCFKEMIHDFKDSSDAVKIFLTKSPCGGGER